VNDPGAQVEGRERSAGHPYPCRYRSWHGRGRDRRRREPTPRLLGWSRVSAGWLFAPEGGGGRSAPGGEGLAHRLLGDPVRAFRRAGGAPGGPDRRWRAEGSAVQLGSGGSRERREVRPRLDGAAGAAVLRGGVRRPRAAG